MVAHLNYTDTNNSVTAPSVNSLKRVFPLSTYARLSLFSQCFSFVFCFVLILHVIIREIY